MEICNWEKSKHEAPVTHVTSLTNFLIEQVLVKLSEIKKAAKLRLINE